MHICSGLSRDCTLAIASMTDTLIRCSGHSSSRPTILHSFILLGNFSRMCLNVLLAGLCNIVLSAANIDRGTTLNSYVPTDSFMSTLCGRLDLREYPLDLLRRSLFNLFVQGHDPHPAYKYYVLIIVDNPVAAEKLLVNLRI